MIRPKFDETFAIAQIMLDRPAVLVVRVDPAEMLRNCKAVAFNCLNVSFTLIHIVKMFQLQSCMQRQQYLVQVGWLRAGIFLALYTTYVLVVLAADLLHRHPWRPW